VAALIVAGSATAVGPYIPLFLLASAYMVWSFPRPTVAIATIILMNAYVFERSEGISPLEIGVGIYLYCYLAYWFFVKLFLRRDRLVESASDFFIVAFLLVCYISVVMLIASQSRVDYWFRESLTMSTFLLVFPAREAMRTDRGVAIVFGSFALMVASLAIVNLVQYRSSTLAANYLWELWGGRKPFGSAFYGSLAVGAVSLHAHVEGWPARLGTLLLAILGALALGTTFYRGFWIGAIIGGVILLFLVSRRGKSRLLGTLLVGGVLAALAIYLMAGNLGEYIVQAFWERLASSGKATNDISIANRLAESRTVLAIVQHSPLVGHGLGVWFSHFNIITRTTEVVMYVHNMYVYLLLKVGVIGLFLFLGFFLLVVRDGIAVSRRALVSPLKLAMVRGSVAVMLGFLFVATNSGILQDKQVILVLVLSAAIVASSEKT
jgi:O-antigen ligase